MFPRLLAWAGLVCLLAGLLSGCDTGTTPTPTPPPLRPSVAPTRTASAGGVADLAGLEAALQAAGLTVTPAEAINQPILGVKGRNVTVNDGTIQAYEYADAAAATKDTARIQPDGTIPGTDVMWVAQPHFYRAGRLVIIYVGTDPAILSALKAALGAPFAEGPSGGPGPTPTATQ